MGFPSLQSWRRQNRGSSGPRPGGAEKHVSGKAPPDPGSSYAPAHGTHGLPHAPRGESSRRVAALRERTLASTAAALRVAEQTERVAGATLRELDAQSESLGRTKKKLEDAETSAETSEKVLDEMRACACASVSCFSFLGRRASSRARARTSTGATPRTEQKLSRSSRDARGDADERDERSAGNERARTTTSSSSSSSAPVASSTAMASSSLEAGPSLMDDDAIGANAAALSDATDAPRRAGQAVGEKLDERARTVGDVGSRAEARRARLARAGTRSEREGNRFVYGRAASSVVGRSR